MSSSGRIAIGLKDSMHSENPEQTSHRRLANITHFSWNNRVFLYVFYLFMYYYQYNVSVTLHDFSCEGERLLAGKAAVAFFVIGDPHA
jgi:hypothetical protein